MRSVPNVPFACDVLSRPLDVAKVELSVHQSRVEVGADVRLHAEVPVLALLRLMHLGVARAGAVLGGTGRRDQGGVDHAAALEQQPLAAERGVDGGQDLLGQAVLLEQVAEAQDGALIGQAGHPGGQAGRTRGTGARRITLLPSPGRKARTIAAGSGCAACWPRQTAGDRGRSSWCSAARSGRSARTRGRPAPSRRGTAACVCAWQTGPVLGRFASSVQPTAVRRPTVNAALMRLVDGFCRGSLVQDHTAIAPFGARHVGGDHPCPAASAPRSRKRQLVEKYRLCSKELVRQWVVRSKFDRVEVPVWDVFHARHTCKMILYSEHLTFEDSVRTCDEVVNAMRKEEARQSSQIP